MAVDRTGATGTIRYTFTMDFFVSQARMQNGVEFINESKKPLFVVVVVDGDGEQDETPSMVHGCCCYCVEAKVHFLCSY